jgi:hypothetical protein
MAASAAAICQARPAAAEIFFIFFSLKTKAWPIIYGSMNQYDGLRKEILFLPETTGQ